MSGLALPKGSLILITGSTGTIGAAIADEVLKAGYKVRAPIRNAEKGKLVTEIFDKRHGAGAYSTVLISNIAEPGALDEATKGCAGVVHVMSDTTLSPDPNKVIPVCQKIISNVLTAASKTPSVKRVVYTSSQAVLPRLGKPGSITQSSWNPDADQTIEYAWAEPHSPEKAPVIYRANKISEERACWDFVEREKPSFVLNTVVPGFAIGEVLHPKLISSSNGVVLGMLQSNPGAVGFITAISPSNSANLKDIALLHLAALTNDRVSGRRLLALGEEFDLNRMVDVLDKLVPANNLPPKLESIDKPIAKVDTAFELELLKELGQDGFVGFEKSVTQCISTFATGTA